MLNICPRCGQYRADKVIDPKGPYAICPECGARQPFQSLPLLVVTGASGAGKSAVCSLVTAMDLQQAVPLDSDILWMPAFNQPGEGYRTFFETWLRMCKNIHQSGRPVVLFGAGLGVPENLFDCVEARYFASFHFLALVCTEAKLRRRLESRPAWRQSRDPAFIEDQVQFNQWFKDYTGQPPIQHLDTTTAEPHETARQVVGWIDSILTKDR
jgi:hypothetical protein